VLEANSLLRPSQASNTEDTAALRQQCATAAKERAALRVILDAKIRGIVKELAAGLRETPVQVGRWSTVHTGLQKETEAPGSVAWTSDLVEAWTRVSACPRIVSRARDPVRVKPFRGCGGPLMDSAICRARRDWSGVRTCSRAWSVPPSTPWAATRESGLWRQCSCPGRRSWNQLCTDVCWARYVRQCLVHHHRFDCLLTIQENFVPSRLT